MDKMEEIKTTKTVTIVKTLELENGRILEILDSSRKIGVDAYLVVLEARMAVAVEQSLFIDDDFDKDSLETIIAKVGPRVLYEYREERNFIMAVDKDDCFQGLMDQFFETLVPYLARVDFPRKFVLKRFAE